MDEETAGRIVKKTLFAYLRDVMSRRYTDVNIYREEDVHIFWLTIYGEGEAFSSLADFKGDYGRRLYLLTRPVEEDSVRIEDFINTHSTRHKIIAL